MYLLGHWFSWCDPWALANLRSIMWELVRTTDSQIHAGPIESETLEGPAIFVSTNPPGHSDIC